MSVRSKIAALYLLGFALDVASMLVLNAALPTLRHDLHATVAQTAWVGAIHGLGLTMAIPLGGWLTVRFGERRVFVMSLVIACMGALSASLAPDIGMLLAWRFVQGLGGGLLVPVGQAMAYRAYPPQERAKLTTMVMISALVVPACSPMIGGIVADLVSWRWIFGALAFVSIMAAGLALAWLPGDRVKERPGSFDVAGFLLGTAFLASLPLGATLTGARETLAVGGGVLVLALLAGVAYVRHAGRAPDPILRLDFLAEPMPRAGSLVYLCVPGVFTGVNLAASLYLHDRLGLSATAIGMLMLPWATASFAAILVSRRLFPIVGAKPLFLPGMIVCATGTLALAAPLVDLAVTRILAFAALGFGASLCTSTAQTGAFTAVSAGRMVEASTVWSINRQLSFCLGTSLVGGLLSGLLAIPAVDPAAAYRVTFAVAAALMLAPLPLVMRLGRRPRPSSIPGTQEWS